MGGGAGVVGVGGVASQLRGRPVVAAPVPSPLDAGGSHGW